MQFGIFQKIVDKKQSIPFVENNKFIVKFKNNLIKNNQFVILSYCEYYSEKIYYKFYIDLKTLIINHFKRLCCKNIKKIQSFKYLKNCDDFVYFI